MVVEFGPGSLIGSYRVVREIGRGGMAMVYEATHTVLHRRVALKVMHADLQLQPGMAMRMVYEASLFEHLRHPGLVPIYDCNFIADRRPWIAMELITGESLGSQVAHQRLEPLEIAHVLASVADLLAAVHAHGIVHRDLKPDNILMTPHDRNFPLRVIDWGIARGSQQQHFTRDGLALGTPLYMSPEQATGRDLSGSCDIFALGVTAYEALSGHPPFEGRTLAEVVCMQLAPLWPLYDRCDAPDALCALVHDLLAPEPSHRPTALELRSRAQQLVRDLTMTYEAYELVGAERATIVMMENGATESHTIAMQS